MKEINPILQEVEQDVEQYQPILRNIIRSLLQAWLTLNTELTKERESKYNN